MEVLEMSLFTRHSKVNAQITPHRRSDGKTFRRNPHVNLIAC